ncbi:MAG: hypothetical protein RLZZ47_1122 [Bacteroidota bacterium]
MVRKSLGLMAFMLLNQAVGAQSSVSVKDSGNSLDSFNLSEDFYYPIITI